jgi:tripartite-type tricarboxylate transporter receptor subunit TctC
MVEHRRVLCLAAGFLALTSTAGITWGQGYPTRPVRILVGFAAGGNFDILARLAGQALSERLQQPVIIENRPGASSNIATEAVVRASADGYTLLLRGAVNTVNATLYDKLSFDFVSDLAPVAGVVRFPNIMTVGASFPPETVPEFIAYAKANPGKINQGSSGTGTTQHLSGELFKMMTGVTFLPCAERRRASHRGSAQRGSASLVRTSAGVNATCKGRQAAALAVTTATRSEALPEVPAVSEFVPGRTWR